MHLRWILSTLVVLSVAVSASTIRAAPDDARSYSSKVVQDRKYQPTHEFSVSGGVLPLDAFAKGITASGGYTLHFTPHFAWEIAQFYYSFQVRTNLSDKLASFDIEPTPFELLEYFLTSNVVFKPIYWKGSWLNNSLLHGEMFFTGGLAFAWFTRSQRPGASLGAGFRIWVSELLSLRLDTRYMLFPTGFGGSEFDIKQEMWIGLGTSFSF